FAPDNKNRVRYDGSVTVEVLPRLAHDAASTVAEATALYHRAGVNNLFIKIPGTEEGAAAIEECIAAGIPINVTLLFSPERYQRAADAYLRGIDAGQDPVVNSVASLFVSRWDTAVADQVDPALRDRLGIAVATKTYQRYRELLASPRWQGLAAAGAQPQKLLFASTSTKDPEAPDTLYISALAAPDTINTMPERTLEAFADHGEVGDLLPPEGGDADEILAQFDRPGSRSPRWPRSCKTMVSRPSTRPGTACWPPWNAPSADWEALDDQRTIGGPTYGGDQPPAAARLAGAATPRR
ncbi:MAG: transaldolase family protein, partial [Pseudonocardiaceae bacterium]